MPFYTAQAVIPTVDNVQANYATNTWHFFADDVAALADVVTSMRTFYNYAATLMNGMARQADWEIKFYDDEDPEPRAPVLTSVANASASPSGDGLPPEVALCVSFQGDPISGFPQARRRGRIYLPFFKSSTNGADGRPTATTCSNLAIAANTLMDAGTSSGTWHWVVYSAVAPGYTTVTNGWVNNEWDTQRRRGRIATARYTWN